MIVSTLLTPLLLFETQRFLKEKDCNLFIIRHFCFYYKYAEETR